MDAVDIIKVCFRRWYVMLPILLGAAGVGYQLVQSSETTFTAAASYGLVQPGLTPSEQDRANPLGPDGGALVGAALEAQLTSRETQEELGSTHTRGWGPGDPVNHRSYDVRIPPYETTFEVRTWGEDEEEVRAVVDRVIAAAPDLADEAQVRAGVPPEQRYQPFVLAPTQVDALPATSALKLVIAVMGVGLLMGAAWSIVVDRTLRWRQTQGQQPAPTHSPPPVGPTGTEPLDPPPWGPDPPDRPLVLREVRRPARRRDAAAPGGPDAGAWLDPAPAERR